MELKQKTLDYLTSTANNAEKLLELAMEYRNKIDNSKTNVARELYGKKLKKIVARFDEHVKLFVALEEIKKKQDAESTVHVDDISE